MKETGTQNLALLDCITGSKSLLAEVQQIDHHLSDLDSDRELATLLDNVSIWMDRAQSASVEVQLAIHTPDALHHAQENFRGATDRLAQWIREARQKITEIRAKIATTEAEKARKVEASTEEERRLRDAEREKQLRALEVALNKRQHELDVQLSQRTTEAAQKIVQIHAAKFDQLSSESAQQAEYWRPRLLTVSALAVLIILIEAHIITAPATKETTPTMLLHDVLPRALVVSVFFVVIGWIAKNYNAARHNQILNSRRAAAVAAFDSFTIATSGNRELQMEVLRQVTAAIFSDQATGYIPEREMTEAKSLTKTAIEKGVRSQVEGSSK